MGIDYTKTLDRKVIDRKARGLVDANKELDERGEKFVADKETLEAKIEEVQNSRISEEDKRAMINELNMGIEVLTEQYDRDVAQEEQRLQLEQLGLLETMQEGADELERLASDFRSVQMEAGVTDASAAADEADTQKQEFLQMQMDYREKQRLLMEQAVEQQRRMRKQRLSGR